MAPYTIRFLLFNQTILLNGLLNVVNNLQGPTLVYHDGYYNLNTIVDNLSNAGNRSLIIVRYPQKPALGYQHTPCSTVLLAEEPQPLVTSLRKWDMWHARSRVLVILRNENEARGWISALWQLTRAVNVVAMTMDDIPSYFTWFPYQENECSNVSTITQLNSSYLFQPKIDSNLNNCPLYAVTSPIPPVVIDDTTGIEPRIFLDLAKKLVMEPTYVRLPPNSSIWVRFDSSGAAFNGLKLLADNEVDLMFGSLVFSIILKSFCEHLPGHSYDAAVFFVPGPQIASRATAIYRAFAPSGWFIVFITSAGICAVLAMIAFRKNLKINLCFIHTLAITLCIPFKIPKSRFYQIFAICSYFYSMHITTGYQSSLLIFLSDIPREKPVLTVEQIASSKMKILFNNAFKAELEMLLAYNKRFSFFMDPGIPSYADNVYIEDLIDPKAPAIIGSKLAYTYSIRTDPIFYDEFDYPKVIAQSEHIIPATMSFLISRGHPLLPILQRYTLYLFEGGFPNYYASKYLKRPCIKKINLVSFNLSNVEGPFILWLGFICISLVVFLCELVFGACYHCFQRKLKLPVLRSPRQIFFARLARCQTSVPILMRESFLRKN